MGIHAPRSPEEEHAGRLLLMQHSLFTTSLGPGLLEKVYEACFCHELAKRWPTV